MHIRPGARFATALFSCSLLAACGGGGGGGSTPVAGPTSTPGSVAPQRTTIRSDAQAVLAAGKVLGTGGYSAGGPPLGAMAVARLIRARRTQAVQCSSGGASGIGSVSSSFTTDAQGNETQVYNDYYDANCQQTERIATLVYPPGSRFPSGSVTGQTTQFDRTGAVTGYATMQSSYTSTSVTVQTADAKTVNGAIVGRSGATCITPSTSSNSETCGLAAFATVASATTGVTESVNETFTANGQNFTATATVTATTYTGGGLTLVPPSSGTAWGLSGGTQLDSITGTGNATYNGSLATSATYSMNDSTAGITAAGSITGTSLTLTLVQGTTTLATITIDADGNGTITYTADGSRENVAGFTIFG